jgi:hypothetical protein
MRLPFGELSSNAPAAADARAFLGHGKRAAVTSHPVPGSPQMVAPPPAELGKVRGCVLVRDVGISIYCLLGGGRGGLGREV